MKAEQEDSLCNEGSIGKVYLAAELGIVMLRKMHSDDSASFLRCARSRAW